MRYADLCSLVDVFWSDPGARMGQIYNGTRLFLDTDAGMSIAGAVGGIGAFLDTKRFRRGDQSFEWGFEDPKLTGVYKATSAQLAARLFGSAGSELLAIDHSTLDLISEPTMEVPTGFQRCRWLPVPDGPIRRVPVDAIDDIRDVVFGTPTRRIQVAFEMIFEPSQLHLKNRYIFEERICGDTRVLDWTLKQPTALANWTCGRGFFTDVGDGFCFTSHAIQGDVRMSCTDVFALSQDRDPEPAARLTQATVPWLYRSWLALLHSRFSCQSREAEGAEESRADRLAIWRECRKIRREFEDDAALGIHRLGRPG